MHFLTILMLIFITLKLVGAITWSWFWVLSPWVIPWIFFLGLAAIVVISMAIRPSIIRSIKSFDARKAGV